MSLGVIVQDDVVPLAHMYRENALSRAEYRSFSVGPDVFHGLAKAWSGNYFEGWLSAQEEPERHKLTFFKPELSFFRKSGEGQPDPNYIHHDAMLGDWTAILYLNPEPHPGDGTIFWEHKSGSRSACTAIRDGDMDDVSQFTERFRVKAQFNRAVIFPSQWFHSRALFENYGKGDDARLIQIAFGKVV